MATYLEVNTPEDVVTRFKLYRRRVEKLKGSRFLSTDIIQNELHLSIDAGGTVQMTTKTPDDECVEYFAAQVRPFVLDRDDTNHLRNCNDGRRFFAPDGLRGWSDLASKEYLALMANPLLTGIPVYLSDDRALSPQDLFDMFICAEGPHAFAQSTAALDSAGPWDKFLKVNFVKLCVSLYLLPLQVLADTIGVALGDLDAKPIALDGPPADRVLAAEGHLKQGRELLRVPLSETRQMFPRVRLGSMKRPG